MEDQIYELVDNRQNILFSGVGGVGKSTFLKKVAERSIENGIYTCCTATTGVAAITLSMPEKKISASTLHSWAGIGVGEFPAQKLAAMVKNKDQARKRWCETQLLIIDEISMLGRELFEKLDYIGRTLRRCPDKPFGGIQLLVSGDFLQLPPVRDQWIFTSPVFEECNFRVVIFTIPRRFDDIEYFHMLLRIRKGEHTKNDLATLESKVVEYNKWCEREVKDDLEVKPTIVYPKKVDVDEYNEGELMKLPGALKDFIGIDNFKPYTSLAKYDDYIKKLDDHIPKSVRLKVGAQVMLKVNLDVSGNLVNGSRGVVVAMHSESIEVKFLSGRVLSVDLFNFTTENKEAKATRKQIPFILAWASSIHKSQGSTLDWVIGDLGPSVFSYGQAYVALSRVRNLKGLLLRDFYPSCIKVDKDALAYNKLLEERAEIFDIEEIKIVEVDEEVADEELIEKTTPKRRIVFCDEDGNPL